MNPKDTAVLLIEFQNEWLSEDGALHFIIRDQVEEKQIVRQTVHFVNQLRELGVAILHVPISFSENYKEVGPNPHGVLSAIVANKRFQASSDGAKIYPDFALQPSDILVEGRKGVSGFTGSNLDHILRSLEIKNILVAGFATEVCVESTIREGFDRGYRPVLISTCTAAHSNTVQRYVEETIMPYFGNVMTAEQAVEHLTT